MIEKVLLLIVMLWALAAIPILIYVFVKTARDAKKRGVPYYTAWGGVMPILYWFLLRRRSDEELKPTMWRLQIVGLVTTMLMAILILITSARWVIYVIRDPAVLKADPVGIQRLVFLGLVTLGVVWFGVLLRKAVKERPQRSDRSSAHES